MCIFSKIPDSGLEKVIERESQEREQGDQFDGYFRNPDENGVGFEQDHD